MDEGSTDNVKMMIGKHIIDIQNRFLEVNNSIEESKAEAIDFMHALIAQVLQSTGPLILKTPKVIKNKRTNQRIETIPEDCVLSTNVSSCTSTEIHDIKIKEEIDLDESSRGRSKRKASKNAADNIKKQQSITLLTKLRRPSSDSIPGKRSSDKRSKRTKSSRSSSDEDEDRRPSKHSKVEENKISRSTSRSNSKDSLKDQIESSKPYVSAIEQIEIKKKNSSICSEKQDNKMDEVASTPILDETAETSMYEDAIGKPTPIMHSTMKLNSTALLEKAMNVTVVLEPLQYIPTLNETVTITKKPTELLNKEIDKQNTEENNATNESDTKSGLNSTYVTNPTDYKNTLQDKMHKMKETMINKEFESLITDDESSPEIKKRKEKGKNQKRNGDRKKHKQIVYSSSSDDTTNTNATSSRKENNLQDKLNTYKSGALFSPYAKESVKKRVEAFEQAGMNTPKPVNVDAPVRITRTKTRAMAAAENEKNVAQKLARKSLAKAKRISLARQVKDNDEGKENKSESIDRNHKLLTDKLNQKQSQKTTPLSKPKSQMPLSVNRFPRTPVNHQLLSNYTKPLTASRSNIVTSMESLIPSRTTSKNTSIDRTEERKRKINEEDARRKREEALKLQTEEKRRKRQEKELKNKLAREAKEKQELEKRQRTEREREEKARIAQQLQEKQREEMEKKRLAQLQRAQEKEEKRRQEEQLRLQKLLEQEETERYLAEQRRREQEEEKKRREAEARMQQQQAAVEAMRLKNHFLAAQAKNKQHMHAKNEGPSNYILESDPDDESDDESRPKYVVPFWAQSHIRKAQLAMQRYIPDTAIYAFFDTRKCTPDLTELFIGIDRSRLKRTSSAIWKTPPRFSMMEDE